MFTFFRVLLKYPMTVLRKEELKREPASGEAGCFSLFARRQTSSKCDFVFPKNSCQVRAPAVLLPSRKLCCRGIGGCEGGEGRASQMLILLHTHSPAYTMLFQSANLYMYIQAMFTEIYLHWWGLTCSQFSLRGMTAISHMSNDSDPSHCKVHWLIS